MCIRTATFVLVGAFLLTWERVRLRVVAVSRFGVVRVDPYPKVPNTVYPFKG